jgi:hypothetical protein
VNIILKAFFTKVKRWGGVVVDGSSMPFGKYEYKHDLYGDVKENQGSPVLISNSGRYIWCDEPFRFEFNNDSLKVTSNLSPIKTGKTGNSLRDAYMFVSQNFFPPQVKYRRLYYLHHLNTHGLN